MSREEIEAFLMSGTRTGKVSTVRKDGRPHLAPIWFVLDSNKDNNNNSIIFTTGNESVKGKDMLRDPRVSLCVDDQTPPFSFVVIERLAEINQEPDLDELLKWTTKIASTLYGTR